MLNDLSKDLLCFLETIFEEVPHEVSIKDIPLMIGHRFKINKDKRLKKIIDFSITQRYISIKEGQIILKKEGEYKLFELRKYFSQTESNKTRTLSVISIIIAFLALISSSIPASQKVYWTEGDSCPNELTPSGTFTLQLNNYGEIPSLITLNAIGSGINIRKSYLDNKSKTNFSDSFMLPPTAISGGYNGNFIIEVINDSEPNLYFNFSYTFTSYILGFIPFSSMTIFGKEFTCDYNKTYLGYKEYSLIPKN